jgi:hypothetical protein
MQSTKEILKNKVKKIAKQTWAGPGKFGVFIVICIFIVATFESLGLSNREKNLELRSIPSIVIPVSNEPEKSQSELMKISDTVKDSSLTEKLKISTLLDFEKKNMKRENIILYGAVDQYLFEHKTDIKDFDSMKTSEEKAKFFLSLMIKKVQDIITADEEEDRIIMDI